MTTLSELANNAREHLRNWINANPSKYDHIHSAIYEIANGSVPTHNWDILSIAANNIVDIGNREAL